MSTEGLQYGDGDGNGEWWAMMISDADDSTRADTHSKNDDSGGDNNDVGGGGGGGNGVVVGGSGSGGGVGGDEGGDVDIGDSNVIMINGGFLFLFVDRTKYSYIEGKSTRRSGNSTRGYTPSFVTHRWIVLARAPTALSGTWAKCFME